MRLALRELRRRPGRFSVATVILTLIALLLMFLGGLLDGLLAASTGAYRAQRADLIVYSADARESLVRSRLTTDQRALIDQVEGVEASGGLGSIQLGARMGDEPQSRDLIATVLFGYELAPEGLPDQPPGLGTVIADTSLGVSQQRSTFNQIIGVTIVIAVVVVALFFALITLERTALYGVLKALGASGAYLFVGVIAQAVVVTLIASTVGAVASVVLDAVIPPGAIPFEATTTRIVSSILFLFAAAVAGCGFSLRRVLRIEPASAIGTAS